MEFRIQTHTHTRALIFLLISAGAQEQEVLGVELKEMLNQNRGHILGGAAEVCGR